MPDRGRQAVVVEISKLIAFRRRKTYDSLLALNYSVTLRSKVKVMVQLGVRPRALGSGGRNSEVDRISETQDLRFTFGAKLLCDLGVKGLGHGPTYCLTVGARQLW